MWCQNEPFSSMKINNQEVTKSNSATHWLFYLPAQRSPNIQNDVSLQAASRFKPILFDACTLCRQSVRVYFLRRGVSSPCASMAPIPMSDASSNAHAFGTTCCCAGPIQCARILLPASCCASRAPIVARITSAAVGCPAIHILQRG